MSLQIAPHVIPRRQPRNLETTPSIPLSTTSPPQLKSFEGVRGNFYKNSPAVSHLPDTIIPDLSTIIPIPPTVIPVKTGIQNPTS